MPSLNTVKKHRSTVRVNYDAIWEVRVPQNITHDGQGTYKYVGSGGSTQGDIGTIRTVKPLCHRHQEEGLTSFEITILDTGT